MTKRVIRRAEANAAYSRDDQLDIEPIVGTIKGKPVTLREYNAASNGSDIRNGKVHINNDIYNGTSWGHLIVPPSTTTTLIPNASGPYDETNVLEGGEVIVTHRLDSCDGYWCCIHNPSPHHMRGWKQTFNFQMKIIMRVCACGEEHPDPDDIDGQRIRHACACNHCSPRGKVVQKRLKRTVAA